MPELIVCNHCERWFLPRGAEIHCGYCAPGHSRLQAECASQVDALAALALALDRLTILHRNRDLKLQEAHKILADLNSKGGVP